MRTLHWPVRVAADQIETLCGGASGTLWPFADNEAEVNCRFCLKKMAEQVALALTPEPMHFAVGAPKYTACGLGRAPKRLSRIRSDVTCEGCADAIVDGM